MKKDPMGIVLSLLTRMNLIEDNREYNVNEMKDALKLDFHWNTIRKYSKIIELIQKYGPKIEVSESKVKFSDSEFLKRLTIKEKFILYLFSKNAVSKVTSITIEKRYRNEEIEESVDILYGKFKNKYYLTPAGLDIYRALNDSITEIIFNELEFDEEEELNNEVKDELINTITTGTQEFRSTEVNIRVEPVNYKWIKPAVSAAAKNLIYPTIK